LFFYLKHFIVTFFKKISARKAGMVAPKQSFQNVTLRLVVILPPSPQDNILSLFSLLFFLFLLKVKPKERNVSLQMTNHAEA
jgi:hypothetical protein